MKTILVTGGAGFIGSEFVRQTIESEDKRVVVLDKLTYSGNLASLRNLEQNERFIFRQGDISDGLLVHTLLQEFEPTEIINFAAESHVDRSIDASAPFVQSNVVGTWQLLEATLIYWNQLTDEKKKAFRFLQISTDEVYGSLESAGTFTEASPYRPNSPYAASKAAADHFVRAYNQTYGLPTLLTQCSNNYGAYQFPEKLIPKVILNALEQKPIPIYGNGKQVRDWIHVSDHCQALRLLLKQGKPGQNYNISSNQERTNLEIVQTICQMLKKISPKLAYASDELITHVADRPGHDFRYSLDASKLKKELTWEPKINLNDGLEKTVRWYLDNLAWVRETSVSYNRHTRQGLG